MAQFQIKISNQPREIGLWLQVIILANPGEYFMLTRQSEYIICAPVDMQGGEDATQGP